MPYSDIYNLEKTGYDKYSPEVKKFKDRFDLSHPLSYSYSNPYRDTSYEQAMRNVPEYTPTSTMPQDLKKMGAIAGGAATVGKGYQALQKAGVVKPFADTKAGALASQYGKQYWTGLTKPTAGIKGAGYGAGTYIAGEMVQRYLGDDDPTTFTAAEMGGAALKGAGAYSSALALTAGTGAGAALAGLGPVGWAAAIGISLLGGKKKRDKARKAAAREREKLRIEEYQRLEKQKEGHREAQDWYKEASMFQNPYGFQQDANRYVPSYETGGDYSAGFESRDEEINKDFYMQVQNKFAKAAHGMKVAEMTGNEVVVPPERQEKIEQAIAKGDSETPAKEMRKTINEGKVTAGKASHNENPMPIMEDGSVLSKDGSPTGIKADNGAGIYHKASTQFKKGMSNSEMTRVIKKNIKSWKKDKAA